MLRCKSVDMACICSDTVHCCYEATRPPLQPHGRACHTPGPQLARAMGGLARAPAGGGAGTRAAAYFPACPAAAGVRTVAGAAESECGPARVHFWDLATCNWELAMGHRPDVWHWPRVCRSDFRTKANSCGGICQSWRDESRHHTSWASAGGTAISIGRF